MPSRMEANQLREYQSDLPLQKAVKQYKNYCTIRRDLRKVDEICNYVIKLHEDIKSGQTELSSVGNTLHLVRAAVMHAIVLYARWFKATTGKPMLKPDTFFGVASTDLRVHTKVVEHRDKYVAHNQLDLLGGDRVWVETDENGKFVRTESDWDEEMWLQDNEFNMESFQKCVHVVHNKIDAEIIPDRQQKLDQRLELLLGSQA